MRTFRLVVLALAAAAGVGLTPAPARAQHTATGWQDSWFWGLYGGYTTFGTIGKAYPSTTRTNAPTIGADWVITRSRWGLNLFAEQSYFNTVSTVADYPTSAPRAVDMTDMRRVGFSAMLFMPEHRRIKPYVGLGYSLNFVKSATPQGTFFSSPQARDSVIKRVESARTAGKAFGNIGLMVFYGKFTPFAQYTIMPTKGKGGSLVNGDGFTDVWTIGARWNMGTSLSKNW